MIITPEVTYLPVGMLNDTSVLRAKAGGLGDVSAALIKTLFDKGADVHVAIPNYRSIFHDHSNPSLTRNFNEIRLKMPNDRIHLAEDRAFFYLKKVYTNESVQMIKLALAFQREVINNILPVVQPDIIHCNDWMTGLIPGIARRFGTPSLFTIHNIFSMKCTLAHIEDSGIDGALFWDNLFYDRIPNDYFESRDTNPVDFLLSGVFSSHFVNTVSPHFLTEIIDGRHDFIPETLRREISNKCTSGCAAGILNAPDPSFNPVSDNVIARQYGPEEHDIGKRVNKLDLQEKLGLTKNKSAPVFFWPSRLDNTQKGCQLLAHILYDTVSRYWDQMLQIVFIADGDYFDHFLNIVKFHGLGKRVAVHGFDQNMEHSAYAGSDFILMPSKFEPCGLPQMIAPIYGSLPVAHDTGGVHDTITHLDLKNNSGNGFLFKYFDSPGLAWAVDQAMIFFNAPKAQKQNQITRIMNESINAFNHDVTAQQYIRLYEKMLNRPLVNKKPKIQLKRSNL